jgi:microsomal dipeptidase-like Zn-dependent dipeptidase
VIVDLHAHYPMHVVPRARVPLWRLLRSVADRRRVRDHLRAQLVGFASLFLNYQSLGSGPRVRIRYLHEGGVGVALSVLYSFFDEADVARGPEPQHDYLQTLQQQIIDVEAHAGQPHKRATFAHGPRELERARRDGKVALVHCVEGGFHLGGQPVELAVERLARRGVAYITLAHLIWRGVATDAPALPFLTDDQYHRWFPQPSEGLSNLGTAAVRAMVRHHVLIDIAHMSERAVDETFALLDELDPRRSVPVIASHSGYRFGTQEYMLSGRTLECIARRNGVVGLIFATHQLTDGLPRAHRRRLPRAGRHSRFQASFETLRCHIDAICKVTGSHRYTALGSDFDGFIKPTLPGLRDMRDMSRLEQALRECYGDADAGLICSDNALRVLTYWQGSEARII